MADRMMPLSETRPLRDNELWTHQGELLEDMLGFLGRVMEEPLTGSRVEDALGGGWARPGEERGPRVLMLDGPRGSGKTSLLLTLLSGWNTARSGARAPDWASPRGAAVLRRLRILPISDLNPVPADLPIYGWLLTAFQPICQQLDGHGVRRVDHLSPSEDAHKPFVQRLSELQHTAISGWNAGKTSAGAAMDDWVLERSAQLDAWASLEQTWRCFVDDLLKRLREMERTRANEPDPLLLLPLDDVDLYTGNGQDLLLALRRLWHGNVAFLLTGDSQHLLELVELAYRKNLGDKGSELTVRRLSEALLEKAISRVALFRTPDTSLRSMIQQKKDRPNAPGEGVLASVGGFTPEGRGALADQLEAYRRLSEDLPGDTRIPMRALAQLVDVVGAVDEDPERGSVEMRRAKALFVHWGATVRLAVPRPDGGVARELPFFDVQALRQSPPLLRVSAALKVGPINPVMELQPATASPPTATPQWREVRLLERKASRLVATVTVTESGQTLAETPLPAAAVLALDNSLGPLVQGLTLDSTSFHAHSPLVVHSLASADDTWRCEVPWPALPLKLPEDLLTLNRLAVTLLSGSTTTESSTGMDRLALGWVREQIEPLLPGRLPTFDPGAPRDAVAVQEAWIALMDVVDALILAEREVVGRFLERGLMTLAAPEAGLTPWLQQLLLCSKALKRGRGLPPQAELARKEALATGAGTTDQIDAHLPSSPWAIRRLRGQGGPSWWLGAPLLGRRSIQELLDGRTYVRVCPALPEHRAEVPILSALTAIPSRETSIIARVDASFDTPPPPTGSDLPMAWREAANATERLWAAASGSVLQVEATPSPSDERQLQCTSDGLVIGRLRLFPDTVWGGATESPYLDALQTVWADQDMGERLTFQVAPQRLMEAVIGSPLPVPPFVAWLDHELLAGVMQLASAKILPRLADTPRRRAQSVARGSAFASLAALLESLFGSPEEIRRLVLQLPFGDEVSVNLPYGVPLRQLTTTLVEVLQQRGMIEAAFFNQLKRIRPGRALDIDRVARQHTTPPNTAGYPRGPTDQARWLVALYLATSLHLLHPRGREALAQLDLDPPFVIPGDGDLLKALVGLADELAALSEVAVKPWADWAKEVLDVVPSLLDSDAARAWSQAGDTARAPAWQPRLWIG